jgi:hypothetical protein
MFSDSEIAFKISNAGTETEAIIYSVIAPYTILNLIHVFNKNSFLPWSFHRRKPSHCCKGVSCRDPVFDRKNGA